MFGNFASSFITNCHVRACAVQRRPPPQLSSFVFPIIIFAAAAAENDCPVPGSVGQQAASEEEEGPPSSPVRLSILPLPLSLSSHPWGLPSPLIIISRWKHLAATAAERKEREAAAIPVGFPSPSLDDGGDDESLIFPHAQRQDKARRRRRRLGPRRPRLSGCCPIRTLSFVALPLLPPRADVGLAVRLPETAAVDDASLIFHFAPNDSRTSIRQGPDQEEDEFTFFYMANFRPSPVRLRFFFPCPRQLLGEGEHAGGGRGTATSPSPLASPPPFTSTFFLR